VQWLKEGERNRKFFHHSMIHKRHINHIKRLEYEHNNSILDHEGIETELLRYYKELLSEPPIEKTPPINRVTQHITTLITPEQNQALIREIM
jgi:hypothetical protein